MRDWIRAASVEVAALRTAETIFRQASRDGLRRLAIGLPSTIDLDRIALFLSADLELWLSVRARRSAQG